MKIYVDLLINLIMFSSRYKLYTEMKWPAHGGYPSKWLNVYVILYAACIPG